MRLPFEGTGSLSEEGHSRAEISLAAVVETDGREPG